MSNWQVLNRVCFTICIICLAAGCTLALTMIWYAHDNEFLLKAWLSMGVVFFASAGTLIVSRVVGGKAGAPT